MTDKETADVYAATLRKILAQACEVMNQAKGCDQMVMAFNIAQNADGRFEVAGITVDKVSRLVE